MHDWYTIEQNQILGGEGSGIESIDFSVEKTYDGNIHFIASITADEEIVIDASESDFPSFDVTLTIEQFKSLCKMMLRFDEKIST